MIDVAIDAVKKGGQLALRYFKNQPKVTYKPDNSPVTRADIETEKLIRKIITKNFPDHGIIGEELPPINPKAKYQWVIDPIDGTVDFTRGIETWSTYLAVLENGKPIIGIAFYPSSNELFSSQKGKGTYLNDKKTHVSKTKNLEYAFIAHGSLNRFGPKGKLGGLVKICDIVKGRKNFGSLSINLVLKGKVDINLEAGGGIHDFAAPAILVEEAGGKFSDFSDNFSLTSNEGICSNGFLHSQVLKLLNSKS